MKTLETNVFESSQHDVPREQSGEPIGEITLVKRGTLTPEKSEEQKKRFDTLARMSDDEIDFSEIPRKTEEQIQNMVHGPWTERAPRTVTLKIDDEVAEWLEEHALDQSYLINLVLKREAQRDKRRRATGALDKAS